MSSLTTCCSLWLPSLPCTSGDSIERRKAIRKIRLEILCKTHDLLPMKRGRGGKSHSLCLVKKFSHPWIWKKCKGCIPKHRVVVDHWEGTCLKQKGFCDHFIFFFFFVIISVSFVINMVVLFSVSNEYESTC